MAGNRRILVGLAVLALVLTACQGGETGGGGGDGDVKTDIGVTTEPCPGGNAERDCIYLGVLSDLTEGPFRALAVPITEGQKAFWKRVNDQGEHGESDEDPSVAGHGASFGSCRRGKFTCSSVRLMAVAGLPAT